MEIKICVYVICVILYSSSTLCQSAFYEVALYIVIRLNRHLIAYMVKQANPCFIAPEYCKIEGKLIHVSGSRPEEEYVISCDPPLPHSQSESYENNTGHVSAWSCWTCFTY